MVVKQVALLHVKSWGGARWGGAVPRRGRPRAAVAQERLDAAAQTALQDGEAGEQQQRGRVGKGDHVCAGR